MVLTATLLASWVLSGCGGSSDDETVLGQATGQDQVKLNAKRIADLARRKREREQSAADAGSGTAGRDGVLLDEADRTAFDDLVSRLGGEAAVAVSAVGSPIAVEIGSLSSTTAWSTIKLAIAARVVQDAGGPGALPTATDELVRRAMTASDNEAAAMLFGQLEAEHGGARAAADATGQVLRDARDVDTVISTRGRDGFSSYGQTSWALADQNRFTALLAARSCILDPATSDYLLRWMGKVVPDQSWGLGAVGVPARFKGGWGPEPDGGYLVRQTGVIEPRGATDPLVVSLAAKPADGQFASGAAMLTEIAGWVLANAVPVAARSDCK
jgi:hypothetical protein